MDADEWGDVTVARGHAETIDPLNIVGTQLVPPARW